MKAFPTYYYQRDESGMDLRDYFAAKALQVFIAAYGDRVFTVPDKIIAENAYDLADAMMKAREAT